MAKKVARVAVIGGGPAGAIVTDSLIKERAFETIRVFERKEVAGGTWVYCSNETPRIPSLRTLLSGHADLPVKTPCSFPATSDWEEAVNSAQNRYADTGVHEHLHSNLPPHTMCFTQEPIPDILSDRTLEQYGKDAPFRHREVIRQWVENIFAQGGSLPLIEFNTTVERLEKKGDEWLLTLRKADKESMKNYWWQEVFDSVVVATGHFSIPYVPDIPGLLVFDNKFPGKIKHSKHFRSLQEFQDKKVIVVGGSVSAFDALHEVRTVAKHPVISSLKEPLPAFGWNAFIHPHVTTKPPISRFHSDGSIEFCDGSTVYDVDIVLFATGYDFSFPFLPDAQSRIDNKRIKGLYQHVFDIENPTLAFIGMVSGGLTFRVYEWQAVAVARMLAGRAKLPPKEMLQKWEQERLARYGNGVKYFDLSSDFEGYFENLRLFAGQPAIGSEGRMLPRYDPAWKDAFLDVIVKARMGWWNRQRQKAEEEMHPLAESCWQSEDSVHSLRLRL